MIDIFKFYCLNTAISLSIYAKKNCIKNWSRIDRNTCNTIVQKSYQNSLSKDIGWSNNIKQELATVGLYEIFITHRDNEISAEMQLSRRLVDIFHQSAFAAINKCDSKLRTYSLMKTKIGYEEYLNRISSINDRRALTKFRLSNHSLMIEKGRHLGINRNARFCKFCLDKVEDEIHFLITCKTFDFHRKTLFQIASNNLLYFDRFNDKAKFIALLNNPTYLTLPCRAFSEKKNNPKITQITSSYLCKTLEIRDFLLTRHKNNV